MTAHMLEGIGEDRASLTIAAHRPGGAQDIMSAIAAKLERYRNPWQELRLQYGANKGKAYTGARLAAA
jgi:hypothetical protein